MKKPSDKFFHYTLVLFFFVPFLMFYSAFLIWLLVSILDKIGLIHDKFFNLFAGTFALMAAVLAYHAATRETKRHEDDKETRRLAYRTYLKSEIQLPMKIVDEIIEEKDGTSLPTTTYDVIFTNLYSEKWEDYALLGKPLVEKISALNLKILEWKYRGEMEKSSEKMIKQTTLNPDKEPLFIRIPLELTKKISEDLKSISDELNNC